jgi:hypothetical protein
MNASLTGIRNLGSDLVMNIVCIYYSAFIVLLMLLSVGIIVRDEKAKRRFQQEVNKSGLVLYVQLFILCVDFLIKLVQNCVSNKRARV